MFLFFLSSWISGEIESSEYHFIIEENGNTIVAVTFIGTGEITIPIQEDVQMIDLEGGLYIMENNELTIAIGSTEKAVLVYKTNLLTEKSGENWKFSVNFKTETEKSIVVAMPKETAIKSTIPSAKTESGDFTKLTWENPEKIEIIYGFPIISLYEENNNLVIYAVIIFVLGSVLFYLYKNRKLKKSARQEQLMQTLTENERKIVEILIGMENSVKRSFIQKKLGYAKSSLAATINNLERKKILEVDRTFSSHFIKITDWFKKL